MVSYNPLNFKNYYKHQFPKRVRLYNALKCFVLHCLKICVYTLYCCMTSAPEFQNQGIIGKKNFLVYFGHSKHSNS